MCRRWQYSYGPYSYGRCLWDERHLRLDDVHRIFDFVEPDRALHLGIARGLGRIYLYRPQLYRP